MSEVPVELKFLSSHEWVLIEDNVATIGVSDHAQELLGDLVYVELPEQGSTIAAGDSVVLIESVKADSDTNAQVSGEVIEVNDEIDGAQEIINNDPYGDGWMYKVAMEDPEEVESLLEAEAYMEVIADEE